MRTVSKIFFAKLCGVTPAAITKALQSGKITLEGKFVNLDAPNTAAYLNKKNGIPEPPPPEPRIEDYLPKRPPASKAKTPISSPKKRKPPVTPKPQKPKVRKLAAIKPIQEGKPAPIPSEVYQIVDLAGISDHDLGLLGSSELDRMKTIEQTLKIRQQREAARGELIPRNAVKIIFAKLHAVDNAEFKTMEDRLTPAICGVFGEADDSDAALQIRKMLNKEIIKVLRHSKRIINTYLQNTGSGAL